MTCREKLAIEYPGRIDPTWSGGCLGCPSMYGYLEDDKNVCGITIDCTQCWDREIPEEPKQANDISEEDFDKAVASGKVPQIESYDDLRKILDSGNRREFETGAVRDIQEGKGRCDLIPLDVVSDLLEDPVMRDIHKFQTCHNVEYLIGALRIAQRMMFATMHTMLLEVAIHFEEGAKKYGEDNWQKGIPVHCYIDSAVRHYLKFLRGDKDEPHDRAFCWNILCAIWTCKHKPELNEYRKERDDVSVT